MVATDFSATSRTALAYAAELSARLGTPLLIASCFAVPAVPLPEGVLLPSAPRFAEAVDHVTSGLEGQKRTAIELGATAVETMVAEGDPSTEIVRVANDRNIDLIVMGTHGRSGLSRALLGSIADKVVRTASCPVMVVHDTKR